MRCNAKVHAHKGDYPTRNELNGNIFILVSGCTGIIMLFVKWMFLLQIHCIVWFAISSVGVQTHIVN